MINDFLKWGAKIGLSQTQTQVMQAENIHITHKIKYWNIQMSKDIF